MSVNISGLVSSILTVVIFAGSAFSQTKDTTKLVLLGTGMPSPNPDKAGPSLAIVTGGSSYIVDCGPGVVRRASAAAKTGISALKANNLKTLFITHLHSDHTVGYPDIILTPAVVGRKGALEVYGPPGIQSMTDNILRAYQEDMDIRLNGLEQGNAAAYKVNVHEVKSGLIFADSNIQVTAFSVHHGSWPYALGYKFQTRDKLIVVSGDCTYSKNLIKEAMNCDILVHEVYCLKGYNSAPVEEQKYLDSFHTSTKQLAEIANIVKPKLLVLTHEMFWGATKQDMMDEMHAWYKGKIVFGEDLDVFE